MNPVWWQVAGKCFCIASKLDAHEVFAFKQKLRRFNILQKAGRQIVRSIYKLQRNRLCTKKNWFKLTFRLRNRQFRRSRRVFHGTQNSQHHRGRGGMRSSKSQFVISSSCEVIVISGASALKIVFRGVSNRLVAFTTADYSKKQVHCLRASHWSIRAMMFSTYCFWNKSSYVSKLEWCPLVCVEKFRSGFVFPERAKC